MTLTSTSRPSSIHYLHVKFLVKSNDAYIFKFQEFQKNGIKRKRPQKLSFHKYLEDQILSVVLTLMMLK